MYCGPPISMWAPPNRFTSLMNDNEQFEPEDALPGRDAADIAQSLTPIYPAATRAAHLKSRILLDAATDEDARDKPSPHTAPPPLTVPKSERRWTRFTPGVEICVLHEDEQRRSALFKLAPGSFLFPHHHDMAEESVVLEGVALVDGLNIEAGDYQFSPAGTEHSIVSSPSGCIVLVHGERRPRTRVNVALLTRIAKYLFGRAAP